MSFFIASAHAQAAPSAPPGADLIQIGTIVILFALFYFMAIRPQRKRQKEHEAMLTNLQKGDEVAMTSGMLGRVKKIEEDYLVLQVGENTELKFQKFAVHAVLPKGTLKEIGQG